ncbi:MAG: NAD(P)H-dependent oxidoreductase [Pseudomonadota bacterium]
MRLAIISGSHRRESQSEKVSRFCLDLAKKQGFDVDLINLAGNPYPFWDESVWADGIDNWSGGVFKEASGILKAASAALIVTPEWSGMVPPGLKNFFLLAEATLAHKPAMLVGITSGMSGTWPIAELKVSSSKNTRIVYTPEHVIIRNVEKLLNSPEGVDDGDRWVRGRLAYSIDILKEYAKALGQVRESGKVDLKTYPTGM